MGENTEARKVLLNSKLSHSGLHKEPCVKWKLKAAISTVAARNKRYHQQQEEGSFNQVKWPYILQ
jgi:hypothetical protein